MSEVPLYISSHARFGRVFFVLFITSKPRVESHTLHSISLLALHSLSSLSPHSLSIRASSVIIEEHRRRRSRLIFLAGVKWSCLRIHKSAPPPLFFNHRGASSSESPLAWAISCLYISALSATAPCHPTTSPSKLRVGANCLLRNL